MKAKSLISACFSLTVSTLLLGEDIPLKNWTVPPYQGPPSRGGITTMSDVTPGVGFVGVAPCRLVDTRQGGFPAGYGIPALVAGSPRNFDLISDPLCTGIPGAAAYSLNITVTNTQGPGFILIYPQGGPQPPVSTLNYVAGQTIANAAIVPAGSGGGVTVIAGVSGTDLIIDINGYFPVLYNPGNQFRVIADAGGFAAVHAENDGTASGTYGVAGIITFTGTANSVGVGGFNDSTGSSGSGVFGSHAGSGVGVIGLAAATSGSLSRGVYGQTNSSTAGAVGVHGFAPTVTGVYGVFSSGHLGATGTKFFVEPHPSEASKVIRYIALEGNEAGTYFRGRGKFQNGIARILVPEDFRIVTDAAGLTVQITPIGMMATTALLKIDLDEIVVQGSRNVEFCYLVQGVRRAFPNHEPIGEGREFMPVSQSSTLSTYLPEEFRRRLITNGTYKEDGTANLDTARRLGWDRKWRIQPGGTEEFARPKPERQ